MSYRYKSTTKRVGLVQSGQYLIEMKLVLALIWLKSCSLGIKQQSRIDAVLPDLYKMTI
jgi:hypothetical protein